MFIPGNCKKQPYQRLSPSGEQNYFWEKAASETAEVGWAASHLNCIHTRPCRTHLYHIVGWEGILRLLAILTGLLHSGKPLHQEPGLIESNSPDLLAQEGCGPWLRLLGATAIQIMGNNDIVAQIKNEGIEGISSWHQKLQVPTMHQSYLKQVPGYQNLCCSPCSCQNLQLFGGLLCCSGHKALFNLIDHILVL